MAVDSTVPPEDETAADADAAVVDPPELSACESSPGRVVFVESGNSDGWLSTDYTVEPTR